LTLLQVICRCASIDDERRRGLERGHLAFDDIDPVTSSASATRSLALFQFTVPAEREEEATALAIAEKARK
jgi:hypothetical protein